MQVFLSCKLFHVWKYSPLFAKFPSLKHCVFVVVVVCIKRWDSTEVMRLNERYQRQLRKETSEAAAAWLTSTCVAAACARLSLHAYTLQLNLQTLQFNCFAFPSSLHTPHAFLQKIIFHYHQQQGVQFLRPTLIRTWSFCLDHLSQTTSPGPPPCLCNTLPLPTNIFKVNCR